ncbi:MAG: hypothetical protein KGJ08_03335 [Gammaproteobacteria bacterium]|nr:hypothetical protein [Gammaproteobacteria bacterium]
MNPRPPRHAMIDKHGKVDRNLTEVTRTLKCLYDIEKDFSAAPASAASYQSALDKIEQLLGFPGAAICLSNPGQQAAVMLAATPSEKQARLTFCQTGNCRACLAGSRPHEVMVSGGARVVRVPMLTPKSRYGVLLIRLPEGVSLNSHQHATLGTLGTRLAHFAEAAELRIESERRALREERLAMARDLHDSLAHTLAYLKIQLLRLRSQLDVDKQSDGMTDIVNELSQGLTQANAQVRELISTFRVSLPPGGFEAAVADLVGQSSARSHVYVRAHNTIPGSLLTANEQINVIQILKESLFNAERHSSADSVWVRLYLRNDGNMIMEIEDDGVGIQTIKSNTSRNKRYGLGIIRERARILHGKIRVLKRRPNGTIVCLSFVPESCKANPVL